MKKLKNSRYKKDSLLSKLILSADNTDLQDEDKIPTRADFFEKRETNRSTLYSFDGPFQLIHADVGNLEVLGKIQRPLDMFWWLSTCTHRRYMFILCH